MAVGSLHAKHTNSPHHLSLQLIMHVDFTILTTSSKFVPAQASIPPNSPAFQKSRLLKWMRISSLLRQGIF
ncbi:MAG: hypothetical protein IPM69_12605 [Ignavibacteria bacterium]|nr:hypothetical protein [Ignavibacteria bacterium]